MGKRLIFNLLRAESALRSHLGKLVKDLGIDVSAGESGVLFLLNKKEMSMGELVSELMLKNSAVTRLVDNLERKKYVKRKSTKEDRRKYLVSLTDKGKSAVLKLSGIAGDANSKIEDGFTDHQIDIFLSVLESIQNKFKGE